MTKIMPIRVLQCDRHVYFKGESMTTRRTRVFAATVAVAAAAVAVTASAGAAMGQDRSRSGNGSFTVREPLSGFEETPLAISTPGNGRFSARVDPRDETITFRLSYADLEGDVTMAHIHFGTESQSGGIAAFLCANVTSAPPGTPACPDSPATVTGVVEPADVIGPVEQGIQPGEFGELVEAIRTGTAYVNVHTTVRESGEIRGQFEPQR
jgi:hypothetical protein